MRQIEIIHGKEDVSRSYEIVCCRGGGFSHACFRETQRHLLASIVIFVLVGKQARKRQSGFNAIRVWSIEGAREALLRGIPFPQKQESIAGGQQHSSLVRTLLFCELHILQRLGSHL